MWMLDLWEIEGLSFWDACQWVLLPLLLHSPPSLLCNTWASLVPLGVLQPSCSVTPRGKWSQPRQSVISSQPRLTGEVTELDGVCCPKARAVISYWGSVPSVAQGHVPLLWSRTADPSPPHKSMRQARPCPRDPSEHTPMHLSQIYPSNEKKNN